MTTIPTYRPSKKHCKVCNREFHPIRTTDRHCSMKCAYSEKKRGPAKQIKRQPIAKVSKKRAVQNREYYKVKLDFMIHHPKCQVCHIKYSKDIHHKRGRIGDLLTDSNYFLAVCRSCHEKIETSPDWARKMGFSENRFIKNK